MGEVDQTFINPINLRPKLTKIEDDEIPIIDISPITSLEHFPNVNASDTDPKIHALVTAVREACAKWGFFQVVNHGVPLDTIVKLERASEKFFGQSKEEKRKVNRCLRNPFGYGDDEHTGDIKDWREGFDFGVYDSTLALVLQDDPTVIQLRNQWPEYPPELRDVAEAYAVEVLKLGRKLLEVIGVSLELSANCLTDLFKDDPVVFGRLSRYIPCSSPELVLGIGAHKDSGGLSILREDEVGGLQVKRKSDGEWISVKPVSNAFIINIGDTLQVWTNDKYESVEHRVVLNPNKDRNSIAFFLGPAYHVNVKPLEELVDEHNPPKYKTFNYGAFRASVLRGNVSKPNLGKPISLFKIP